MNKLHRTIEAIIPWCFIHKISEPTAYYYYSGGGGGGAAVGAVVCFSFVSIFKFSIISEDVAREIDVC